MVADNSELCYAFVRELNARSFVSRSMLRGTRRRFDARMHFMRPPWHSFLCISYFRYIRGTCCFSKRLVRQQKKRCTLPESRETLQQNHEAKLAEIIKSGKKFASSLLY